MSYVTFAAGLLLAIAGAAAMAFGYGIVNVERGWATLIGGAAAFSGGVVTMALALILHSLGGLRAALTAQRFVASAPGEVRLAAPAAAIKDEGEPELIGFAAALRPEPAEEIARAEIAGAMEPRRDGAPDAGRPNVAPGPLDSNPLDSDRFGSDRFGSDPLDSGAARAAAEPVAAPASLEDIRRVVAQGVRSRAAQPAKEDAERLASPQSLETAPELSSLPPALATAAPSPPQLLRRAPLSFAPRQTPRHLPRAVGLDDVAARPSASPPPAEPPAQPLAAPPLVAAPPLAAPPPPAAGAPAVGEGTDAPAIIGRYESDGTAYVMYADGSIDARSERGAFYFRSMAELKSFMDAQAGA